MANQTTTCPICKGILVVSVYSDRSVGINFDYDVLDGSTCDCDYDDDTVQETIGNHLYDNFGHTV